MFYTIVLAGFLLTVPQSVADVGAKTEAAKQYQALLERVEQEGRSRELAGEFLELAEADPRDPVAVEALTWIVANLRRGDEMSQALEQLAAKHAKSERLADLCRLLPNRPALESEKLLRALLEQNPQETVQAQACFYLAQYLQEQVSLHRTLKSQPEAAKRFEQYYGEKFTAQLAKLDQPAVDKEIERLYDRVAKSYADVEVGETTMGDVAKLELFAIRNLSVGRQAPEIAGEDIEGRKFKLSDYRGKIVVLDFWGNW